MTTFKLSRDANGNTIVTVRIPGHRGFSIQTLGNLPETHRTRIPNKEEIFAYVRRFGTLHQKRSLPA